MTEITTGTQIYENHIYRHFSGVNAAWGGRWVQMKNFRVFRNYIHHVDAYSLEFKQFGDETWVHDNILYENTENFPYRRVFQTPQSSISTATG